MPYAHTYVHTSETATLAFSRFSVGVRRGDDAICPVFPAEL
jgi:hypothetical protein